MSNPGPATTTSYPQVAVMAPVAGPTSGTAQLAGQQVGQGSNGYRLLASAFGVSLAAGGDAAVMPVINSVSYIPLTIVFSNGLINGLSSSVNACNAGIYTAALKGGTTLVTEAAVGAVTAVLAVKPAMAETTTITLTSTNPNIYFNINASHVVAGGTMDVFVYGFDLSTPAGV